MPTFKSGQPILKPMVKAKTPVSNLNPNLAGLSAHRAAPAEDGTTSLELYKVQLTNAIRAAVRQWQERCWLNDYYVRVDGPLVSAGIYVLKGPNLDQMVFANTAYMRGDQATVRTIIAESAGSCFELWQVGVNIPNVYMYPDFLFYPGGYATPTPNRPTPLSLWRSDNLYGLSETMMQARIRTGLLTTAPDLMHEPWVKQIREYISYWWGMEMSAWLASRQVTELMGYGPVPSYKPPLRMAGPVEKGSVSSSLKIGRM